MIRNREIRNLRESLEREILPNIEKPSRYLGNELNTAQKHEALATGEIEARIALVFPDLYDLGLGNLGLHILYVILNELPWCWAERAYAPALDLERELRTRELPLFAWESKDELGAFDGIGFTLQTELTYTNILNILDLAGIPLRTADRSDAHPLTFAGGPAVFNPEPLAPFMDFFVIGDGEDVVIEVAETLRRVRGLSRAAKLVELARIQGVYVPALYPMETLDGGRIVPRLDAPKIVKRTVASLDGATFPTRYIVPFTKQVHDRASLEVLRGCTQGCRFCQAGMTTRPVRERSLVNVGELMERTLASTGYEEVSLVSLSTCDYSRVRTLVEEAAIRGERDHVSVSLPSLRLDSFSVDLADRVAGFRRSGLTFAPEAASPRLRALINKWIPDEDLLTMSAAVYDKGWDHVKLYFMIGLPTERDEDVDAIADLTVRTLKRGRSINRKAKINTGVSTFVPKPFTPFQWARQIGMDECEQKQRRLYDHFRQHPAVKFGRHNPEETFLEGLVSRADRRVADVIEAAFRKGARFDAWDEFRNFALWREALAETGYDPNESLRERALDERLPWDHIDVLIPKEWFQEDWNRAQELAYAGDCRSAKCHQCGVIDRERDLCLSMLRNSRQGAKEEKTFTPKPRPTTRPAEPDPVQRIWLRIGREGEARFLSHLETMNVWIRALRRARLPLAYSQGFHAHARVAFSTAPPVGEESRGDYLDVLVAAPVDVAALPATIGEVLPAGFRVFDAREMPRRAPSLQAQVDGFIYRIELGACDAAALEARVAELLAAPSLVVERLAKSNGQKARVKLCIRATIESLAVGCDERGVVHLDFITRCVNGRTAKPREILELLGLDVAAARVIKLDTMLRPIDESVRAPANGASELDPDVDLEADAASA